VRKYAEGCSRIDEVEDVAGGVLEVYEAGPGRGVISEMNHRGRGRLAIAGLAAKIVVIETELGIRRWLRWRWAFP
jgi:hypothetical protein